MITYNECYYTDNAPVSVSLVWILNKDAAAEIKAQKEHDEEESWHYFVYMVGGIRLTSVAAWWKRLPPQDFIN